MNFQPADFRHLNRLLTPAEPAVRPANGNAPVERRERLGALVNFYCRRAA
jgi:hypothetical protein